MAFVRLALPAALVLAGFVPVTAAVAQAPVEWYTDTGGGGALAQPVPKSDAGGAVGPVATPYELEPPGDLPLSDISASEPVAGSAAADEPVPDTPATESAPQRERSVARARAAQEAPTVTGGQDQDTSSDTGVIGALPLTGLQLAAVAGAGLCLIIAGALLRPRRRPAASR